jgi:4-diphosphocytidyl-2-C-methyl-D-erythritol kinase
MSLVVTAPAKVNLSLHVTGRRADGYHLLDSLVVFAGVYDRLTLDAADTLSLTVEGPGAAALAGLAATDNIVLTAARTLAAATGTRRGAHLTLHKALPVAAGIGGGSADAAAALTGLARLWGVSLPADAWTGLAAALGADVPVCLRGRPTTLGGIGEILAEAPPLPAAWLLLVNPGVALSTPAVFRARQGPFGPPAPLDRAPADAAALAAALAVRRNDLSEAAISLAPEIGDVLDALSGQPGCLLSRMSGSGATCWGLFAGAAACRAGAAALRQAHPRWWIAPAPVLGTSDPVPEPRNDRGPLPSPWDRL